MLTFSLFIGVNFIAAEHGERTRVDVVQLTKEWLLR